MTIAPTFANLTRYWDANGSTGTGDNTPWFYPELRCELEDSTGLEDYTVTENGTLQGTRIFPGTNCTPNAANTNNWDYRGPDIFTSGSIPGGYIYANGNPGLFFRFDCPVPNTSSVLWAMKHPIGANHTLGCNVDDFGLTSMPWSLPSSSGEFPSKVIPAVSPPQLALLIPPLGSHKMVCGLLESGNGDGGLMSYRTTPQNPLSRTGWVASGSGTGASNAIDNNNGTRWTSNAAQASGQHFEVNMGSAKTFKHIIMDSAGSSQDFPRTFDVFVSANGTSWGSAIAHGTSTAPVTEISFPTQTKQWVQVKLNGSGGTTTFFSIHEFNLYNY